MIFGLLDECQWAFVCLFFFCLCHSCKPWTYFFLSRLFVFGHCLYCLPQASVFLLRFIVAAALTKHYYNYWMPENHKIKRSLPLTLCLWRILLNIYEIISKFISKISTLILNINPIIWRNFKSSDHIVYVLSNENTAISLNVCLADSFLLKNYAKIINGCTIFRQYKSSNFSMKKQLSPIFFK